jgi:hypothetical protein
MLRRPRLLFRRRNRREPIQPMIAVSSATDPLSQVLAVVPDVDYDCLIILWHLYEDVDSTIKYANKTTEILTSIHFAITGMVWTSWCREKSFAFFHFRSSSAKNVRAILL